MTYTRAGFQKKQPVGFYYSLKIAKDQGMRNEIKKCGWDDNHWHKIMHNFENLFLTTRQLERKQTEQKKPRSKYLCHFFRKDVKNLKWVLNSVKDLK